MYRYFFSGIIFSILFHSRFFDFFFLWVEKSHLKISFFSLEIQLLILKAVNIKKKNKKKQKKNSPGKTYFSIEIKISNY